MKNIYLIGYSGHAFVVADSAIGSGYKIMGYFEAEKKQINPFQIEYLGSEEKFDFGKLDNASLFVSIGNNYVRKKIMEAISNEDLFCNVIDVSSVVSVYSKLGKGVYIGKRAVVNPLASIGNGTIINTSAVVEHECIVGEFVHIAPMAVLCGNVTVGDNTFIGANSVIRQGITIGSNVTVGAGSVITKNIPDNVLVYGNPAQIKNANII